MTARHFVYGSIVFLAVICLTGNAQAGVVSDTEYGFRITIPDNWRTNSFMDGKDKVWAFAAPDQNSAIRIRAFKAPPGLSMETLMSGFETHVLNGGQKLIAKPHALNGINGKMVGYKGRFNNIDVGIGCFYTIHNGNAYIVWSMIPVSLFNTRSGQADAIMNTFTLPKNMAHHRKAAKLFQDKRAGYTIEYPDNWIYEKSGNSTVVFSGQSGTKAYYSTVSIQNLLSNKMKAGKYQDVDAVVDNFLGQLAKAKGSRKSDITNFIYSRGNLKLMGKQFIGEYSKDGERFRQWTIVLPRPNGEAFHTWFYTSPTKQYDEFLVTATTMLNSWIIAE